MVTVEEIAATTGSSDLIRAANALVAMFGDNFSSVTTPGEMLRESNPTGIKLPSADKTWRVKFATTSDVFMMRSV